MGKVYGYQALVMAASAGDTGAFEELVRRFRGLALSLSRRRLSDYELAEDAVQEAFLSAYLNLSNLDQAIAFPSWFRKILRTCCNRLEKQERISRLGEPAALPYLEDPLPGPDELLVRFQSRAMVARTLEKLDGVIREACIQRYVLGRPYKDIASELGVPQGTIKRRLHDARDKLIKAFESPQDPAIRVGYLPVSDHLMGMVSHHVNQGRLRIQLKKFLSWAGLVSSLVNESLDAAFVMAPLALALRNQGVPIVYAMDAHHDGSALTVQSDAGTPGMSLRNRVGIPYTISTHSMILREVLGMDRDHLSASVTPTYRGPSYLFNSLATGAIDAFICAEPWNTKAAVEGSGRILTRSKDFLPGHICCVLVIREEFLRDHLDLTRDYLKLLASCTDYIMADYGRSARIQERYTGVSADIIECVLNRGYVTYNDLKPDRGRMEAVMGLALRSGLIDRPCDLDRFILPEIN
jgi:NitT/TauT family transport system substrate-binding protein